MNEYIGILLAALIGIIPGTYAIIQQRKNKRAEAQRVEFAAQKIDAEQRKIEDEITEAVLVRARAQIDQYCVENETLRRRIRELEENQLRTDTGLEVYRLKYEELSSAYEAFRDWVGELELGIEALGKQIQELGKEPVFTVEKAKSKRKAGTVKS